MTKRFGGAYGFEQVILIPWGLVDGCDCEDKFSK